jgi:hypothetical protein
MWTKGNVNGYQFCIKHFEESSEFGIRGGRISKLTLTKDGKVAANYDRGWDIKPVDDEAKEAYKAILKKYN